MILAKFRKFEPIGKVPEVRSSEFCSETVQKWPQGDQGDHNFPIFRNEIEELYTEKIQFHREPSEKRFKILLMNKKRS